MTPLFSIITVCLNCKEKIEETARSLQSQHYDNYEYIIKDGGSTDGTEKIINHLDADIVVSKPDEGIFDAMNQALYLCRGDYVYFLNAGDKFHDDEVLKNVGEYILSHSGYDLYYGDIFLPDSRGKITFYPEKISRYRLFTLTLCHQVWFLSRRKYLDLGGFQYSECLPNHGGDYKLFLKLMLEEKIRYKHIPRIIANMKWDGVSTNLEFQKRSHKERQAERERLFIPFENKIYPLIFKARNIVKKTIYDRYLHVLFRRWNILRYKFRNIFYNNSGFY